MTVSKKGTAFRLLVTGITLTLMAGMSRCAQAAGTQTFTFEGGKPGKTVPLLVSANSGATFHGPLSVGILQGTLSNEPQLGLFELYCVDIRHTIGTPFQTLAMLGQVIDGAQPLQVSGFYEDGFGQGGGLASALTDFDYKPTLPGPNPSFDTIEKRVNAVSYLSQKYLNSPSGADTLAKVQLAIWDIVQDGGDGVGAGQGSVQAKTADGSAFVDISAILAEAAGQAATPGPEWLQAPRVGGNPNNHLQDFVFNRPSPGPTRTWGFWKTHLKLFQKVVNASCINLGVLTCTPEQGGGTQDLTNPSINILEAIFWTAPGQSQTPLGQARLQLAHQLIAGQANVCYLGTTTGQNGFSPTLLADAVAALGGTDIDLILSLKDQLDNFNNSGDALDLPAGIKPGPADPKGAKALATRDASGNIDPGCAFR